MTINGLKKEFKRIKDAKAPNYSPGYAGQQFKLLEMEIELKKLEFLSHIDSHLKVIAETIRYGVIGD